MSWWRRNWRWMLAIGLTALAGILVLILWLVRRGNQLAELKTQLALQRTTAKVAGLVADKKSRAKELKTNATKASELSEEITAAKKKVVALVKEVDGLSDVQVAMEFNKLGY